MKSKSLQIQIVDNARLILALLVVFTHCCHTQGRYEDTWPWIAFLFEYIQNINLLAVPGFFVLSGYLFYLGLEKWSIEQYKKKIYRRVYTLLIPYFLWNISYIVFRWAKFSFKVDNFDFTHWVKLFWNINYIKAGHCTHYLWGDDSIYGPILGPFWYIKNLMLLILVAPVIYYLIKNYGKFALLILSGLYILGYGLPWLPLQPEPLLFFSIGAYCAIHQIDYSSILCKYRPQFLLFLFLTVPLLLALKDRHIYYHLWNIYSIPATIAIFAMVCRWNMPQAIQSLVPCSFFVYAGQMFVLPFTWSHRMGIENYPVIDFLWFLTRPIIVYLILSGIYFALKKMVPSLFGWWIGSGKK